MQYDIYIDIKSAGKKYKTVENELKIIPGKIKTNPIKINVYTM